jgi:tetraprenyl-beta-curcumene synthase
LGNLASIIGMDLRRGAVSRPAKPRSRRLAGTRGRVALARTFASTVLRYCLTIFPAVRRELSHWRGRAERIEDPTLRSLALDSLAKRGNMEGAALFGAFAPRAHRAGAVRALVAFQAAYNYFDLLAEQRSDDPQASAREQHGGLTIALAPTAACRNLQPGDLRRGDREYVAELIATARSCLAALPSYALVADAARTASARIVEFQSLNLGEEQGSHEGLERWARGQTPPHSDLRWWESAAAAGSSLGVHVLIGLAAQPQLDRKQIAAVEAAYHPWIGALHSLLDSLVDVEEDRREGQRNLVSYYTSSADASARLAQLTERARSEARRLVDDHRHEVILAAMTSYYLSAPTARARGARPTARAIADAAGPLTKSALPLFTAARIVSGPMRPKR